MYVSSTCIAMSHSRGRKACIGLLGLALAGLAVDRLLLGGNLTGPASATASSAPAATPSSSTPNSTEANVSKVIAQRFESLRPGLGDASAPDAFASILTPLQTLVEEPAAEPQREVDPAAEEVARAFQKRHRLQAVLVPKDGGEPRALVGGKLLGVGDAHDGATLVEVRDQSAIFEIRGIRVEIALRHAQSSPAR